MSTDHNIRELPQYQSHKKVWALQIKEIDLESGRITPVEEGYAPFTVDKVLFTRYTPVAGDYFVTYPDGYTSISPKAAFEEGYTRL